MVLPVNPQQDYKFVCEDDRKLPEAEQTIFTVRPLTAKEEAHVTDAFLDLDLASGVPTAKSRIGARTIAILNLGLVGWQNFPPDEEKDLPFRAKGEGTRRVVADKSLSRIPPNVRTELANAITDGLGLNEEREGNSE
jgi:hypothetical protein